MFPPPVFSSMVVISTSGSPRLPIFQERARQAGLSEVPHFQAITLPKGFTGVCHQILRRPGALGCYLSHRAVVSMARALALPQILIFEDDAEFSDGFVASAEALFRALPDDWDLFFLGSLSVVGQSYVSDGLGTGLIGYGTHGYVVRGSSYDKVLAVLNKYTVQVDSELTQHTNGLVCYFAIPALCGQIENISELDGTLRPRMGAQANTSFINREGLT